MYLIPEGPNAGNLSPSFLALTATDGINSSPAIKYGKGLGNSQKNNFAPRFGFAYQMNPKLVVRGGWGMFYNGFENRGFSPNIGENYPFQFQLHLFPERRTPITPVHRSQAARRRDPAAPRRLKLASRARRLSPSLGHASGLACGHPVQLQTPYTMGGNLTVQYQLTPTMSVQVALCQFAGAPPGVVPELQQPDFDRVPTSTPESQLSCRSPTSGYNSSYAATGGMQHYQRLSRRKLEKQFGNGLNFLFTYTSRRP